jgi:hypothetical protein
MQVCSLTGCDLPARVLVRFVYVLDDEERPYHAYCVRHSGVWRSHQLGDVVLLSGVVSG